MVCTNSGSVSLCKAQGKKLKIRKNAFVDTALGCVAKGEGRV